MSSVARRSRPDESVARSGPQEPGPRTSDFQPRLKLGYRRFSFVQIGATDPASPGVALSEPFESFSLDVYLVSSLVRLGLSTQYGWQSGTFRNNGDMFVAESLSIGLQLRGRITPFVETLVGGGYMRRVQFATNVHTAYWQFGVDAGAEIFVAGRGYLSLAIGYLRPVNALLQTQKNLDTSFTSVYLDTWSFKIGLGI